jgi:hypothetical protein
VSDFLTGALAVIITGAALFWLTGKNSGAKKQCAES